jgi:D-3-phosphoglycerate dehydrogenase / 2-oxoglutarate reductase
MKPHILVTTSSFGRTGRQPLDMLESFGTRVTVNPYGRRLQPDESKVLLADVDGLIAGTEKLDRDVLDHAPRLRVISRVGTGLDSIDLAAARERGIAVHNTPDAHVDAVAELTLAGILDLLRQVSTADAQLRQGTWKKPMGRLLRGKTVGLVGLGRVGKALVQLLRPFAVKVVAYDLVQDEAFATEHGVCYLPLTEVLAQAEIVSLHLPYSSDRHHFIGRQELAACRKGALLINCARGGLVDEAALLALLEEGHLGGAYLDTFEKEPYQGPLTEMSTVLLTPHIGSYAAECRLRMEVEAVENLLRHFSFQGGQGS